MSPLVIGLEAVENTRLAWAEQNWNEHVQDNLQNTTSDGCRWHQLAPCGRHRSRWSFQVKRTWFATLPAARPQG